MSDLEEALSDLELFTVSEKTELAFQIITSGLIDPDIALKALGLDYTIEAPMDAGEWEAEDDNPVSEQLFSVSTKDIREYINNVMNEMP